ncbi:Uncharacterized protein Fot_04495 [Forsythia ovata]|uniref:Uncharacterized protein n=1 Tax=Forsythia ovata TaxID=205694 RepID=A0ABD1XCQ2_9LAMI
MACHFQDPLEGIWDAIADALSASIQQASRQNQPPIPLYSRHFYACFMDYKRFDRDCVGRNNNGGVEALVETGGDRTFQNLWWCLLDNSTEPLETYTSDPPFDRSLPKGPVVPSPGIIGGFEFYVESFRIQY